MSQCTERFASLQCGSCNGPALLSVQYVSAECGGQGSDAATQADPEAHFADGLIRLRSVLCHR